MTIKDYDIEDTTGYGSHIPALKFIFQHISPKFCMEYGTGFYSTPFLIEHSERLLSIEMQDENWYKQVIEKYSCDKWSHKFSEDVTAFAIENVPDFLFVDGSSVTRAIGVVHGMQRGVDTIVIHDSESSWYGINMIAQYVVPLGYKTHTFVEKYPTTTVYTRNEKLIEAISQL